MTIYCFSLVESKTRLNQFHRFLDLRTWEHLNLLEISTLFGCICRHRTRCTLLSEMITHGCQKVLLWCQRMPSKHRTYPREPGPPMIEENFLKTEDVNALLKCQYHADLSKCIVTGLIRAPCGEDIIFHSGSLTTTQPYTL